MNGLLTCAQNGISHRDLKPENILIDGNYQLLINDFGFAGPCNGKYKDEQGRSWLKTYCGTLMYMAPEIHQGKEYEGKQIDMFSLGIILFILVAGSFPFEGEAVPGTKLFGYIAK